MNELTIIAASYVIEYIFIPVLLLGFLRPSAKPHIAKIALLVIPFSLLNVFFETTIQVEPNVLFLNLILLYLYALIFANWNCLSALILSILVFSSTMLLQAIIVLFIGSIHYEFRLPIPIVGNLLTLLLAGLFSLSGIPHKIYQFFVRQRLPLIIAIANISVVCFVLNIYNKIYTSSYYQLLSISIIPISMIVFINIAMVIAYVNKKSMDKQAQIYQQYLPIVEEMLDQIKHRQHRFDNELQTLKGLPSTYKDYDSLCQAIASYYSYIDTTKVDTKLLNLNYKFLSAFLFQKMSAANSSNPNINLCIENALLYSNTPEYVIIDAVGILFDNMVEATGRDELCTMTIGTSNNQIVITTTNPGPLLTQELRTLFFTKGYSTKDNSNHNRGYGLYDLAEIAKKYNGKIFLENVETDHTLQVVVSLYI